MAAAGVAELREALSDPFLLATGGLGIVPARDANAQRVLQACTRLEQVGAALVDVGVLLFPENVTALGVEKYEAVGKDVDGVTQAGMRLVGLLRDSPALGDVLVGNNPSAAGQRLIDHLEAATVGQLGDKHQGLFLRVVLQDIAAIFFRIAL